MPITNGNTPQDPRAFRRTHSAPPGKNITSATVLITADNEYSLCVNGILIGTENNFQSAQRYVVPLQPASEGVFAVYAMNDRDAPSPAGILVAIQLDMAESVCTSSTFVVTDGAWNSNQELKRKHGFAGCQVSKCSQSKLRTY